MKVFPPYQAVESIEMIILQLLVVSQEFCDIMLDKNEPRAKILMLHWLVYLNVILGHWIWWIPSLIVKTFIKLSSSTWSLQCQETKGQQSMAHIESTQMPALYSLQAKNSLHTSKWLEKVKRRHVAYFVACERYMKFRFVWINNILLEYSHLWQSWNAVTKTTWSSETNISYLAHYRKNFWPCSGQLI